MILVTDGRGGAVWEVDPTTGGAMEVVSGLDHCLRCRDTLLAELFTKHAIGLPLAS